MLETYTPMIEQYLSIKAQHQEEILFFRLGDFYEMFFDDAIVASKELEIALTARDGGSKNKIPMCGVPYHAANNYIARLISKGYKVAICEQTEDPKATKGIVKREVIRVVTAGSFLNDDTDSNNSYIAHIQVHSKAVYLAVVDIFTGEFKYQKFTGAERLSALNDSIFRLNPVELIIQEDTKTYIKPLTFVRSKLPECNISVYLPKLSSNLLAEHFKAADIPVDTQLCDTINCLLSYIHYILKVQFTHINKLQEIVTTQYMDLDATAIKNLELIRNMRDGSGRGSLFQIIDETSTSMGARRLKESLQFPLLNVQDIIARQEGVKALLAAPTVRDEIKQLLSGMCDVERMISKVELKSINPRDLVMLRNTLDKLPQLKTHLDSISGSRILNDVANKVDVQQDLTQLLHLALEDNPPLNIKDGGIFKENFDPALDDLRSISQDSNIWLAEFEQKQRESSGIRNLKVGFSRILGYYIEVSKGNLANVPPYFIRKQTLVNGERFIVTELKEYEDKILGAKEKLYQMELALFEKLRQSVRAKLSQLQQLAGQISIVDLLVSFALSADKYNYTCPSIVSGSTLSITDGRHPVVEQLLDKELFVPNDTDFAQAPIHIITGPNMAGKSTYMRQVALLCIMAQMGSFIPAKSAVISPLSRVFTRVGAGDDLAGGNSTFMVEMQEVANILAKADANSLVILDEVGRGTSTYDGISIARATVEYIAANIKCKTLFATHYHELIELEKCLPGVKNYCVAIRERGQDIVFLRRIIAGGSDKSYGIHVAQLAGLPLALTKRAQELVDVYAEAAPTCSLPQIVESQESQPMDMFTMAIVQELLDYDVSSLTPLEALNILHTWQKKLKHEQ